MQPVSESSNVDRLQFLFMNLVGHVVSVHAVDGSITEGLFVSRTDEDAAEPSIMLSKTRNRRSATCEADQMTELNEIMLVPLASVVFVNAVGVRVEAAAAGRVGHFRQTALEMNWADLPPEDDRAGGAGGSLEDEERGWETGKWDQFEANKKFGVKTTYKEDLYTTTLDKTKLSKEQIEYADRAARDIERSAARGLQHRIERGEDVDVDEGTLYSDVQRAQPTAEAGRKAPAAVPAGKGVYTAPGSKKPPTLLDKDGVAPNSIEQQSNGGGPVPPASVSAPSPQAGKTTTFNVNAKPFVLGGAPAAGGGPGAQQSSPLMAQAVPFVIHEQNVDDMLSFVAAAMNSSDALLAPEGWEGDDEFDNQPATPQGFNQSYHNPHVHHHIHHHHHHHQLHHHHHHQQHQLTHQHHSASQHQHQYSSPVTQGSYGGQTSSQGGYAAQQQVGFNQRVPPAASSPLTDTRGAQQPLPAQNRLQPQPAAPKVSQQQPQQPVASSGPSGGPAPVSEEPRRSMAGLTRGRGGHSNPTQHSDPTPSSVVPAAPSSNAPLGGTTIAKKKGGK